ncbi:hypothetical protein BDW67DRAFT_150894 [Aspergillus spinulosporus]
MGFSVCKSREGPVRVRVRLVVVLYGSNNWCPTSLRGRVEYRVVAVIRKSIRSADKANHRSTSTTVVAVHAESNRPRRRVTLNTQALLAPGTSNNIEAHGPWGTGVGDVLSCASAGGRAGDLDRGRAHGRRCENRNTVVAKCMNYFVGLVSRLKQKS